MSDLIREELRKGIGTFVTVFLMNNFRYAGILLDVDNKYIKINDVKGGGERLIAIQKIQEVILKNGN